MVVVTGATGHLGNTLVRRLCARGVRPRCLVLTGEGTEPLTGLAVETVTGDVRELTSLVTAFTGADTVYHLASVISLLPGQTQFLQSVNVDGTRNVIEACRRCGVRRLVYVSSIHAFVEPPTGTPIDEATPIDPALIPAAYGKSKAEATRLVLAAADAGLDAVIACPTGIIGPFDFLGSEMGRLFRLYARGRMPAYLDGAYDFVDVRDVADGLIAAAERGRAGEIYILAGELISVKEICATLARVTGIRPPWFRAPAWLADVSASVTTAWSRMRGGRPLFTRESLAILRSNSLVKTLKAMRELTWRPRPVRESIADTVSWFREAATASQPEPAER